MGTVGWELLVGNCWLGTVGMNSERMVSFIDKYIYGKYKNNAIIMDNGGSHKSKEIKNKIAEYGNHLLYSVPCRPKTNAIESFFSQLKHYFDTENKFITYSNLKASVKRAMRKIKKERYMNYMKYAYEKKAKLEAIEKEST